MHGYHAAFRSAALILAAGTLASSSAYAQDIDTRWTPHLEAGLLTGGTWHNGTPGPVVSSAGGPYVALGIQRGVSPRLKAGIAAQLHTSTISAEENGETWSGGRITEGNALLALSVQATRRNEFRSALDLHAGFAFATGAGDMQPFRDMAAILPVGSVGIGLHYRPAQAKSEVGVVARYHITHVRTSTDLIGSGAVSRIALSIRVTR